MTKWLLLAFLLIANTVHCEPAPTAPHHLDWAPYATLAAGEALDAASTVRFLGRGCTEGNVAVYGSQPSAARVVVTKAATVGAIALGVRFVETHGHPRVAKVLGYFGGGLSVGVAAYNFKTGTCR